MLVLSQAETDELLDVDAVVARLANLSRGRALSPTRIAGVLQQGHCWWATRARVASANPLTTMVVSRLPENLDGMAGYHTRGRPLASVPFRPTTRVPSADVSVRR